MSRIKVVWHPFLIAAYPILALLAHNVEEIKLSAGLRPLVVSLLGAIVLFMLFSVLMKEARRAALACTLALILFFSYGHFYNYLETVNLLGVSIGRHRFLLPIWMGLSLADLWWAARIRADLRQLTQILNLVAAISLVFPLAQIALFGLRTLQASTDKPAVDVSSPDLSPTGSEPFPDIYYIILDGYGREDVLRSFYGYDNSPFLNQLSEKGFYVAGCSRSNYTQTQLSLATALNMNYLEALSNRYQPGTTSRAGLPDLTKHSLTRRWLEELGYSTVAFETGFHYTEIEDADLYLHPQKVANLTDFEDLFIRTTLARILAEGIAFLHIEPDQAVLDRMQRERVLFTLERLGELPELPGPKFVFAHIVSPHLPHIFGPNGEVVTEQPDYATGYRNQVIYINQRIEALVSRLIANSPTPPVIILQGDHGPAIETPTRRLPILNAYYFPKGGDASLYQEISPVNSFRVILNHYFGGSFELHPDISYYSTYQLPFDFTVVPDNRPGCRLNKLQ